MKIGPLAWRLIAACLVVGLAGAYPTFTMCGLTGIFSEAVACVIVAAIMLLSTAFLCSMAKSGPLKMAKAYAPTVLARGIACAAIGAGVCVATPLPPRTLLVWLLVFYIVTLAIDAAWMIKTFGNSSGGQAARQEQIGPGLSAGNESNV